MAQGITKLALFYLLKKIIFIKLASNQMQQKFLNRKVQMPQRKGNINIKYACSQRSAAVLAICDLPFVVVTTTIVAGVEIPTTAVETSEEIAVAVNGLTANKSEEEVLIVTIRPTTSSITLLQQQ